MASNSRFACAAAPSRDVHASGVLALDRELRIYRISRGAARLVGGKVDDLINRPVRDMVGVSPEIDDLQSALRNGSNEKSLKWQIEADSRQLDVHGFIDCLDNDPTGPMILLMISHVSGRRAARGPALLAGSSPQSKRAFAFAGLLLLIGGLGLGAGLSTGESRLTDESAVDDQAADDLGMTEAPDSEPSPSLAKQSSIRRLSGQVHPAMSVAGVASLDGTIANIAGPSFGVVVEKGDLLVSLDPGSEGDTAMRQARIGLITAKSELLKLENWSTGPEMREAERSVREAEHAAGQAKLEHDRSKMLFDEGIIAANEYEGAVESLRSANLQAVSARFQRDEVKAQGTGIPLDIARERLSIAQSDHDSLQAAEQGRQIRAPISGIFLPAPSEESKSTDLSVGQQVTKGTALFVIGSNDDLIVKTSVSEFDMDLLEKGQKVRIVSPMQPDLHLNGKISSIAQISSTYGQEDDGFVTTSTPTARYDVTVKVLQQNRQGDDSLRIGMTVNVEVETTEPLVAKQPVRQDGPGTW